MSQETLQALVTLRAWWKERVLGFDSVLETYGCAKEGDWSVLAALGAWTLRYCAPEELLRLPLRFFDTASSFHHACRVITIDAVDFVLTPSLDRDYPDIPRCSPFFTGPPRCAPADPAVPRMTGHFPAAPCATLRASATLSDVLVQDRLHHTKYVSY
jgi:hypothetical protein